MVGKATLLYVLGFSTLLAYVNLNMNRQASSAADGGAMYFDYEAAHTLALAGAQMALATLFQDTSWSTPIVYSPSDLPGSYRATRIGNRIEMRRYLFRHVGLRDLRYRRSLSRRTFLSGEQLHHVCLADE